MKRIDTINVREDLFGSGKAGFHDNADLSGQDATYLSPDWLNSIQEELCNILELSGVALNPESKRQLFDLLVTRKNLVNDLTTGGTDAALTAEQGKLFFAMFAGGANYFKIPNPSDPNKPWIVQCGSFSANVPTGSTPSTQQVTFGLVFPNSCVHVSGNFTIGINTGFLSHTCEFKTSTGFNLRALTAAAAGVKNFDYVAIGN